MTAIETTFEIIKIVVVVAAAVFTYYKFFREGSHHQRVEFDVTCKAIDLRNSERILEIECIVENKGNVEQRMDSIKVVIRGIRNGTPPKELKDHEPRLEFPEKLKAASLVSKKSGYYFIRPKVKQSFPLCVSIPFDYDLILVSGRFYYQKSKDRHTAEHVFNLRDKNQSEQYAFHNAGKPAS